MSEVKPCARVCRFAGAVECIDLYDGRPIEGIRISEGGDTVAMGVSFHDVTDPSLKTGTVTIDNPLSTWGSGDLESAALTAEGAIASLRSSGRRIHTRVPGA